MDTLDESEIIERIRDLFMELAVLLSQLLAAIARNQNIITRKESEMDMLRKAYLENLNV